MAQGWNTTDEDEVAARQHKLVKILKESGFKKEHLNHSCKNALKMIKFLLLLDGYNNRKITTESIRAQKSRYLIEDTFDTFVDCLQTRRKVNDDDLIEDFYKKLFKITMSAEV